MKKFYFILLVSFLVFSCGNEKNEKNELVLKGNQQASLLQDFHLLDSIYSMGEMDTAKVVTFIHKALQFAEKNPEDKSTPDILVKAGIMSMRLAQEDTNVFKQIEYAKTAIDIFDKIVKVYPENNNVKYCYWWKGIIYNDILKMYPSAENEYRDFLHKFPNDTLASTIQFSLENVGKSAPEIMEQIEQEETRQ